jgi:hypothetical protein
MPQFFPAAFFRSSRYTSQPTTVTYNHQQAPKATVAYDQSMPLYQQPMINAFYGDTSQSFWTQNPASGQGNQSTTWLTNLLHQTMQPFSSIWSSLFKPRYCPPQSSSPWGDYPPPPAPPMSRAEAVAAELFRFAVKQLS